ncbi:unnamed protein product [Dicrocoelium dendriticum]|nr:unnamed protein product [Dicrocoelium dendriticum]
MYSSKTELVDPDEEHTIETLSVTSTETNDADINIQPVHISTTEGGLSEPQTLMSFIRSNIGTGMLSMPVILRYCGLWTGLSVIFIAGFISTYLMNVLVRTSASVCQRHQLERSKMDYTDTVFYVFKYGPESLRKSKGKMKHTVNVFLLITQIGSLCVYTLFLTENIRYFVGAFAPNLALNFYLVGFIVAAILVPMCLCENMRALALLSVVANVATLFGTILIFAYLFTSGLRPYTSFDAYTNVKDTLIGFCIAMSALEGIGLIRYITTLDSASLSELLRPSHSTLEQ